MRTLTEAESVLINNSEYTVDYSDLVEEVTEEVLEEHFEDLVYDKYYNNYTQDDLGGLIVYFKDDILVAFYDYERFVGTIF